MFYGRQIHSREEVLGLALYRNARFEKHLTSIASGLIDYIIDSAKDNKLDLQREKKSLWLLKDEDEQADTDEKRIQSLSLQNPKKASGQAKENPN